MAIEIFEEVCAAKSWVWREDRVDIELPEGRRQFVQAESFDYEGEAMIRLWSSIGEADLLSEARLRAALGLNYAAAFGALAVREADLVMVDTFVIRNADPDEVAASILYLAATADRFEKLLFQRDTG